ncbi:hypothetical protein ACX1FK_23580 [Pseudomonas aeruginosa]|nr:hypothetical protein [Pseudomonas aeruginosa]
MELKQKVRAAQLSVLSKYGILADFSALEETQLDSALRGTIPAGTAQDMTFASWCDQLLGQGIRLPVARFDESVAGQTRISNLAAGSELAKSIKSRERQLLTVIKAAQQELADLKQLQRYGASAEQEPGFARALHHWYRETTAPLHRILWEIKEIEGAIFDYPGQLNRNYRQQIVEVILTALNSLESFGIWTDVVLRDGSLRAPAAPPITMRHSQPLEDETGGAECFDFVVEGLQADVLEVVNEFLNPGQMLPPISKDARFNCNVSVSVSRRNPLSEDELFHLSCFLHKLFEAMARSGDHRPRGTLREKVILCILLSFTAPCTPIRARLPEMLCLQDIVSSEYGAPPSDGKSTDLNISAGRIVEHLIRVLRAQNHC